ncbi:MAG TPA: SAVED domain-containing protein [Myxococcales bacterium]|nr:SAVED domain-containing protein [Myxococcales bacterium]
MGPRERSVERSPVQLKRRLPLKTTLRIWVQAGGRCEFRGCNEYLLEHHLTRREGNFAEIAHVVGFRRDGPRGNDPARPTDVNDPSNLMLLCASCHTLIDQQPEAHPRALLETFKREHEERIQLVTGYDPARRTRVVQLKARIGGAAVEIGFSEVLKALSGDRWPASRQGQVIDLTGLEAESESFYAAACEQIEREIGRLYGAGMDVEQVQHISLFALAPIPLLVFLGSRLSNKIPVDLYQRHRDTESWTWRKDGPPASYQWRLRQRGSARKNVALVLPLSGAIAAERLPTFLAGSFTIYELALKDQRPSTDFLRSRDDYVRFEEAYRELLARIVADHPDATEIHLFPAVPAPIAIGCGRQVLRKAQPALVVYDFVASSGGFVECVTTR